MNFVMTRIKYICRLGYGDSLPKEDESDGNVPVFGSNGQYATTARPNTEAPAIVIGRKGSYGKVNWAPDGCFASDTTFFVDIRFTAVNLRWLYWALQTLNLDEGSQEAAVPGLNRESVYEQRLPLPSADDQQLIADYLDQEVARIDSVLDVVGSRSATGIKEGSLLALLFERRTALITAAVTGQIPLEEMTR